MPTLSLNASQKTKQTPAGEIPVDWATVRLDAELDIVSGYAFSSEDYTNSDSDKPLIRGDNVSTGYIDNTEQKHWSGSEDIKATYILQESDILLAMDRTWIKHGIRVALVDKKNSGALLVQRVARLRPNERELSAFYLAHIRSKRFENFVKSGQTEGGGVPHISKKQIAEFPIPLPPLPEQRKIADILATWDRALATLKQLIAAKTRRKQALMQQLLTPPRGSGQAGKKRLPGFSGEWRYLKLNEVFERITDKADKKTQRVLSLTAGTGFVDQREKWNREIAGKNIENYILLKRGEFSYNKGNSKRYPQGCIYPLEEFDEGAVPNVWYSFRLSHKDCDSKFYKHYFLSGGLNHQLSRIINSGVRNDGLLNLTAESFFACKVPVPEKHEQEKIGSFLDTADHELRLLKQQRTALEKQKRGLMQQLLTGKVRVKE